jgi:N-acetylglucosaminyl-diphospho-decaprenol L-rhamnosyltransferase
METLPLSQSQDTENVPDFSIILVSWNNIAYLEPCLDSLYKSKLHYEFDVVLVDNGSTDGTQTLLREKYPQVKVIQNDHNVGLSRACNQGIEATTGSYVLLLNDDTLVNGTSLDILVEFLNAHPEAGAVGGQLLNPDGSVQSCYNHFPSLHEEFLIATRLGPLFWEGYPGIVEGKEIKSVDWIGSACLMLRRVALEQVGVLDEEYFIYGDEADLQYRLKKAGWQVYYLPQVTTIHFGGRSLNRWRRRKMVYRGHMLFFRKNYGWLRTGILRAMLAVLSLAKMFIWVGGLVSSHWRERARKELDSNREVVQLCWKLE